MTKQKNTTKGTNKKLIIPYLPCLHHRVAARATAHIHNKNKLVELLHLTATPAR